MREGLEKEGWRGWGVEVEGGHPEGRETRGWRTGGGVAQAEEKEGELE